VAVAPAVGWNARDDAAWRTSNVERSSRFGVLTTILPTGLTTEFTAILTTKLTT
jgi:hypothetical protein